MCRGPGNGVAPILGERFLVGVHVVPDGHRRPVANDLDEVVGSGEDPVLVVDSDIAVQEHNQRCVFAGRVPEPVVTARTPALYRGPPVAVQNGAMIYPQLRALTGCCLMTPKSCCSGDENAKRLRRLSPPSVVVASVDTYRRAWRGRVALPRDRRCTFIERKQAKGVNGR